MTVNNNKKIYVISLFLSSCLHLSLLITMIYKDMNGDDAPIQKQKSLPYHVNIRQVSNYSKSNESKSIKQNIKKKRNKVSFSKLKQKIPIFNFQKKPLSKVKNANLKSSMSQKISGNNSNQFVFRKYTDSDSTEHIFKSKTNIKEMVNSLYNFKIESKNKDELNSKDKQLYSFFNRIGKKFISIFYREIFQDIKKYNLSNQDLFSMFDAAKNKKMRVKVKFDRDGNFISLNFIKRHQIALQKIFEKTMEEFLRFENPPLLLFQNNKKIDVSSNSENLNENSELVLIIQSI